MRRRDVIAAATALAMPAPRAGPTPPTRVLSLDWGLTEMLLSLDVVPVGVVNQRIAPTLMAGGYPDTRTPYRAACAEMRRMPARAEATTGQERAVIAAHPGLGASPTIVARFADETHLRVAGAATLVCPQPVSPMVERALGADPRQLRFRDCDLPRLAVTWMCGPGLGLAGLAAQQVLRNPLAEPITLGIFPGAYLALIVAVIYFPAVLDGGRDVVARAGAGAALGLALLLTSRLGLSPLMLILSGMIVNLCFGAPTLARVAGTRRLGQRMEWAPMFGAVLLGAVLLWVADGCAQWLTRWYGSIVPAGEIAAEKEDRFSSAVGHAE